MQPIKNYENLYLINKNGEIQSIKSNQILQVKISNYKVYVRLYKDGICTNRNVDDLVLEHFQHNYNGQFIKHIDNDPYNCSIDNLTFKGKNDNSTYIVYYPCDGGFRCWESLNNTFFTIDRIDYKLYPRHFHVFKGYENDDKKMDDKCLMNFVNDFKKWNDELLKYDINYIKSFSHFLSVQHEFDRLTNNSHEKFDKITLDEYHLFQKCFNGGHSYLSQPGTYDCHGYDFIANYPSILASSDLKIPTTEYTEYTLKSLKKRKDIELGIYRVKITSDNKEFLKVFSYSSENHYTDTSLKFAMKHKKQFDVNIELIQDGHTNAFIYHDYVTGDVIFKNWFDTLIKIKEKCKGNKLIKHIMSSVWGLITHTTKITKTYEAIIKENIKIDEDYFIYSRNFVNHDDNEEEYYELISMKNIYKYNLRIGPFLTSIARKKLADVILMDDNIDYLIRTQTDNATFSKPINISYIYDLEKEDKTTGKINFVNRNTYFKVC